MYDHRRFGDSADLIEMRRAHATRNTARIAELRAEGRGECCEFHRDGGSFEARAAPTAPALSPEAQHEADLEMAIALAEKLYGGAE